MAERKCIENFRFFPELLAVEIAKFFEGELREGVTTEWGIRMGSDKCLHWLMVVNAGGKEYVPDMCFINKAEVISYCERVGSLFPEACKLIFGVGTNQFSPN